MCDCPVATPTACGRRLLNPSSNYRSPTSPASNCRHVDVLVSDCLANTGKMTFYGSLPRERTRSLELRRRQWWRVGMAGEASSNSAAQMHYVTLQNFHWECVRKMPLSGLDPKMLVSFLCKTRADRKADRNDFRRKVAEVSYALFDICCEYIPGPLIIVGRSCSRTTRGSFRSSTSLRRGLTLTTAQNQCRIPRKKTRQTNSSSSTQAKVHSPAPDHLLTCILRERSKRRRHQRRSRRSRNA